jgi:hypothetical protein
MNLVNVKTALAAIILLAGCEGKMGDLAGNDSAGNDQGEVSAEGQAEEGRISMKGPGFDFALNVPGGLADHANVDGNSKILYPGATISGMHIAAGAQGQNKGGVELRFTSRDSLEKVAGWYRDPKRADGFALASAKREGDDYTIIGTTKSEGDDFKVRLKRKDGSGTQGRLTISERK